MNYIQSVEMSEGDSPRGDASKRKTDRVDQSQTKTRPRTRKINIKILNFLTQCHSNDTFRTAKHQVLPKSALNARIPRVSGEVTHF